MRFLLKHSPRTLPRNPTNISVRKPLNTSQTRQSSPITDETTLTKAWGQQCSSNCGCAIRFEISTKSAYDGHAIIDATYHAIQVVSTMSSTSESKNKKETSNNSHNNNNNNNKMNHQKQLQPLSIHPTNRPMLKECTCKTLHTLASEIVTQLPTMTLSQAQNQFEFTGIRSSNAFRYIVLKDILQSTWTPTMKKTAAAATTTTIHPTMIQKHIPCYDLVEEAIIACLKGYIPKPRHSTMMTTTMMIQNDSMYKNDTPSRGSLVVSDEYNNNNTYTMEPSLETNESTTTLYRQDTVDLDPLRYVYAAKRRYNKQMEEGLGFVHTMPPFHISNHNHNHSMDHPIMNEEEEDDDDEDTLSQKNGNYSEWNAMDWVSYVDEMNGEISDRTSLS